MPGPQRTAESKHGTRIRTRQAQTAHGASIPATNWAASPFARDLLRARWDIPFFAERFLGIKGHPGQVRMWNALIRRDKSGYLPSVLTFCCSAGNRAGKTLGIAVPILHHSVFKMGLKPANPVDEADVRRWARAPYEWYHFAIAQETSELVFIELVRLLTGVHEAQEAGCPLTDELGAPIATWDKKYRGEYLWMKVHEDFGGADIHFRTTGEKGVGSLGKDMNGISWDEAGFDPNFDFVFNEVLNLRRLSTGGPMWIIGTPTEGLTGFADKWMEGDPEAPDRHPHAFSIRMSTRDNVGYGISEEGFNKLITTIPESLILQNIDGHFIEGTHSFFSAQSVDQAFRHRITDCDETCAEECQKHPVLPEVLPPVRDHLYAQGVDPALTFDSAWSIVLDITGGAGALGVRAAKTNGRTTNAVIQQLAEEPHIVYGQWKKRCVTAIDATGFGGKMFRDLLQPTVSPLHSVEFGGSSNAKLKLLNSLKAKLEKGALVFPRTGIWLELRRQLLGYRLQDKNLKTDGVMALAVAVWVMEKYANGGNRSAPFDFMKLPPRPQRVVASSPTGGPRIQRFASYTSLADMERQERLERRR